MKFTPLLLAAATWTAISATPAQAQVIISEIDFSGSEPWIELRNEGALEFDLSNFSIYHATNTPFRVNDYWFAIPTGTKIKAFDYVRILWGVKIPASNPEPRDIYTGDSRFNFLFGHGYEKLDRTQGAIGLCKTKLNSQMNNPDIFADWIQWGGTNFKRGQTAVNSKRWASNTTTIDVPPQDYSLMVIYSERAKSSPPPLSAYQHDASPTKLAHNADPLKVESHPGQCGYRNPKPLTLSAGIPFHGNANFALKVTGTQGPAFFEFMGILVGASQDISKPDFAGLSANTGGDCGSIKPIPGLVFFPYATENIETLLPTPLLPAIFKNQKAFLQIVTFSGQAPEYYAYSNVLELQTSN